MSNYNLFNNQFTNKKRVIIFSPKLTVYLKKYLKQKTLMILLNS